MRTAWVPHLLLMALFSASCQCNRRPLLTCPCDDAPTEISKRVGDIQQRLRVGKEAAVDCRHGPFFAACGDGHVSTAGDGYVVARHYFDSRGSLTARRVGYDDGQVRSQGWVPSCTPSSPRNLCFEAMASMKRVDALVLVSGPATLEGVKTQERPRDRLFEVPLGTTPVTFGEGEVTAELTVPPLAGAQPVLRVLTVREGTSLELGEKHLAPQDTVDLTRLTPQVFRNGKQAFEITVRVMPRYELIDAGSP